MGCVKNLNKNNSSVFLPKIFIKIKKYCYFFLIESKKVVFLPKKW